MLVALNRGFCATGVTVIPIEGLTIAAGISSACSATTHSAIAFVSVYVLGCFPCSFSATTANASSLNVLQHCMTHSGSAGGGYTISKTSLLSAFEYAVDT